MVSKEKYMHFVKEMLKEEETKDAERLKKREENKSSVAVFFIVLFLIIVVPAFIINVIVGIVALFVWFFIVVFAKHGGKSYSYYKKEYRDRALNFLLKDVTYTFSEDAIIEKSVVEQSQMIGKFDSLECSDKLSINIENDDGSKSNCFLTLCDLKATRTEERYVDPFDHETPFHERETEEVVVDVYKGMFGYIEFPFEFKCILCIDDCYHKKGVKMERVKLEDINFNKKFKIYSSDQIEARYILTPDMMSKLLYLEDKFKGLQITLVDNKMYIGAGVNLFELNIKKNVDVSSLFDNFYDEIKTILEIINEIKSNNKIFKM